MTSNTEFARRPAPIAINSLFVTIASRYQRGGSRITVSRSLQPMIDQAIERFPDQVFLHAAAVQNLLELQSHDKVTTQQIEDHILDMEQCALLPQAWDADGRDIKRAGNVLLRLYEQGRPDLAHRALDVFECHVYDAKRHFARTYEALSRVHPHSLDSRRETFARRHNGTADLSVGDAASLQELLHFNVAPRRPDPHDDPWKGYEVQRPFAPSNDRWEDWMRNG